MPAPRAVTISLTAGERKVLSKRAYGHKTPHRDRVRALIVVLAARGYSNEKVASRAGVHPDTARRWRGRFAEQGLAGLIDRPRSGRPARFTPLQSAAVKALACQLPAETGVPLSRWSVPELARHAVDAGVAESVSPSTIRRWLATDVLKPWQYRSWIFITDPDFHAKAQRVLDLYARRWEGQPLVECRPR